MNSEHFEDFGNAQLMGHEKNRTVLYKQYRDGNPAGSYLFSGTEGVGKKITALWYAKMLNCTGSFPPCGQCISCRKIDKSLHPDVRVIAKSEEKTLITIDQIRQEVIEEGNYKPFEGKYRTFIIDDAHLMNDQAQNALLKTLEEPGDSIVIILVTSRTSELLPTIISRCREIRFFPLPHKDIEQILKGLDMLELERIKLLTVFSGGAPGKAIKLAKDQTFWKMRSNLFDLLENLPDGNLEDILVFCDEFKVTRSEVKTLESVFEAIISWFRDISFIQNGMRPDSLINLDYYKNIESIAFCFSPEDLLSIQELVLEVRKLVFENNLNIKMAFQRLFIKIKQAGTVRI
jgi:DNA polymerase-3 subunit delta'